MSSAHKNLSEYNDTTMPDASEWRFGIVVSEWHSDVTHALYQGCYDTLVKHGVKSDNIYTVQVPGSFELPLGARLLNAKHNPDGVICLGCVIRGETSHHDYINQAVATGLMQLNVMAGKPFVFGVLTPDSLEQALERAGGQHGNKGVEAAATAIRMVALREKHPEGKKGIGFH